MSPTIFNPYRYAEDLDVCFTEGESYDLGIGFNSGGSYTRFGVGQRIKTGSDYIGKTLTTASFYIRLVSGKTPSGTLTCTVIPTSGSGGSMSGTDIGTIDLTSLDETGAKINFTGDNTRELEANDCIFCYMPSGTWGGYEIQFLHKATSYIENQDIAYVQNLSGALDFSFSDGDCNWCFNVS